MMVVQAGTRRRVVQGLDRSWKRRRVVRTADRLGSDGGLSAFATVGELLLAGEKYAGWLISACSVGTGQPRDCFSIRDYLVG